MDSRSEIERSSSLSGFNLCGSETKNRSNDSFSGNLISLKALVPSQVVQHSQNLKEQRSSNMKESDQSDVDDPSPFSAQESPAISPETSFVGKKGPVLSSTLNMKFSVQVCGKCGKKTGLLGIKCKCGDNFCSSHKYAEAHDCKFDYRKAAHEQLKKLNPTLKGAKVSQF